MANILVLTPDIQGPGGVSNYYSALQLHLLEEIEYFYVNTKSNESSIMVCWRLLANYIKFIRLLLCKELKLVHINPSLNSKSFYRDGLFCFLAWLSGKKIIVFFRGWEDDYEEKITRSFIRRSFFDKTFGKCKNFIVLSKIFQCKLQKFGLEDCRFWIETTVAGDWKKELEESHNKWRALKEQCTILFMSRLVANKGIYIAMDAVSDLKSRLPLLDIKLILAGDGDERKNAKLYAEKNKMNFVSFPGYVTGDDKNNILSEAHIFLFPTSYGEGLPNVVLEAMLNGMPIVTRNCGGISEIVEDGVNGFVTDSTDKKVFADMLYSLLTDFDLFKRISVHNNETARKTYTSDVVRNRLLNIYKQVLS